MRSPWLLGAAACFVLVACGPNREMLEPRDARADVRTDGGGVDSGIDSGTGGGCPTGAVRCGTDCVNLNTSTVHCGACNSRCNAPQMCNMGRCEGPMMMCTGGQIACGGRCVDVNADSANCGMCGRMCPSGQTCQMGMCRAGGCTAPNTMCGTSCVDTQSSNANCGSCGNACPAGQSCTAGRCGGGGGMCVEPCTTNEQCAATCAPPRSGWVQCCASGGVCIEMATSCGGGPGPTDGGTGGDGGGGLGCLLGLQTCTNSAECMAACGALAPTCGSRGRCE